MFSKCQASGGHMHIPTLPGGGGMNDDFSRGCGVNFTLTMETPTSCDVPR